MAKDPNFTAAPHIGVALVSTANTNRDGTGTLTTILLAPAAGGALAGGSRIDRVVVAALGTTTDGMLRLFLHNGVAAFLYKEIEVSAIVPGAAVTAFMIEVVCDDLVLPAGWSLKAATHNAESFNVFALGGDF
jgi:hypothetical protein